MIPNKIENLVYTSHAIRERIFDTHGCIESVPKHFIKIGCKNVKEARDGAIKVHYIYDDTHDLILVINSLSNIVITNYLEYADNYGRYKGRYRLNFSIKKDKVIATF